MGWLMVSEGTRWRWQVDVLVCMLSSRPHGLDDNAKLIAIFALE